MKLNKKSMLILIADDNPADRRLITEGFRAAGTLADIQYADTRAETLSTMRLWLCTFVVLDINMPGMSGLEVLETLVISRSLMVIRSASAAASECDRALKPGALTYYQKPPDLDNSFEVIAKIGRGIVSPLGGELVSRCFGSPVLKAD